MISDAITTSIISPILGGDGGLVVLELMTVKVVYDGNGVDDCNGVDSGVSGVDDDNGVGGNVNGGSGVDDGNGVDGDWWQRRKDSIAVMIEHIWERYWKSQRVMISARAIVKVQISKCGKTTTFLG